MKGSLRKRAIEYRDVAYVRVDLYVYVYVYGICMYKYIYRVHIYDRHIISFSLCMYRCMQVSAIHIYILLLDGGKKKKNGGGEEDETANNQ